MASEKKSKAKVKNVEAEEVLVEEPVEEVAVELDVPEPSDAAPGAAAPAKKPLGVKEVIPFKWKLVGTANHLTLTLFKAVEREDVEAQLDRIQKEGYYTDLRILEKDAKIVQPKQPPKPPEPKAPKAAKPAVPAKKPVKTKPVVMAKPAAKKVVSAAKPKPVTKVRKPDKTVKKASKKK